MSVGPSDIARLVNVWRWSEMHRRRRRKREGRQLVASEGKGKERGKMRTARFCVSEVEWYCITA